MKRFFLLSLISLFGFAQCPQGSNSGVFNPKDDILITFSLIL